INMTEVEKKNNIVDIWRKFIIEGNIDEGELRQEIAYSWERCYEAKVDPYLGVSNLILDEHELSSLICKKNNLIIVARYFMNNLYKFVKGSGFIVLLSDERGYIMECMGDSETMNNAAELNLSKGCSWLEEVVGTNGIGTALVSQKPVQISGAEHYCQQVQKWTCSAAPICNSSRKIIGVLQMSGPSNKTHQHTLGMVVAAVQAIEKQLKIQQNNNELTVLNNRLNNIIQTVSDGIIVIDRTGIIEQVNSVAAKIMLKNEQEIIGNSITNYIEKLPLNEFLNYGKSYKDLELFVNTKNGTSLCLFSGKSIIDEEGISTGGVIFIKPLKNIINRFSGANATFEFKDIIGESRQIKDAVNIAKMAANNTSNVLLLGESGTGKEIFAQSIHNQCSRKNGPFIAVNCGAIPRELIASELFGYESGAFTGARPGGKPGKFELASGGTLFLDEIGDMPLDQQVALLRVLQEKKIVRIGGEKVIDINVRIICASNKDLKSELLKGNFREDLFYRLNVIAIRLPSLRSRREDIPLLFSFLLNQLCTKRGITFNYIHPKVLFYLQEYNWPGNVREFQNVLERMINITTGESIELEHLPEELINASTSNSNQEEHLNYSNKVNMNEIMQIKETIKENERKEIIKYLSACNGNISKSAKEMGISRNTFYKKMKKFDIVIR
ncbi:MAG: sigma-54-dependent Fis family transcriptional regulator, partial [Eubacteriales bacterium]